jgi:Pyridoxal-dependent decarboxylase, C-terminal sheet domain
MSGGLANRGPARLTAAHRKRIPDEVLAELERLRERSDLRSAGFVVCDWAVVAAAIAATIATSFEPAVYALAIVVIGSRQRALMNLLHQASHRLLFRARLLNNAVGTEPGRSLVGQAGVTLYSVGATKDVDELTSYAIVDGGVSDNPRPRLYEARYSAFLATRMDEEPDDRLYTICGKHCEDDILIRDARLPEAAVGDLVAVPGTGAYTLSQGNNYNVISRPAAVMVAAGEAELIQRWESVEDLLRLQVDAA